MKQCPKCNRAYATDDLNYCRHDGERLKPLPIEEETIALPARDTNLFFPKEGRKVVRLSPPAKQQGEPKDKSGETVSVDEPVVAISINRTYPEAKTEDDLYNVTRGSWRINRQRAERAVYAFAVYKGVIKEVYKIHRWQPTSLEMARFWDRKAGRSERDAPPDDGRSEFVGELAPDAVRQKYVGMRLPRSYGSAIRYINC